MAKQTKTQTKRRYARQPNAAEGDLPDQLSEAAPTSKKPKAHTKISKVIALLERKDGATIEELVKATGWLPHTTRAALTGLKKKGHKVERTKIDDVSRYSIVGGS